MKMNITKICTILIVSLLLVSTFAAFNPIFGVEDAQDAQDMDISGTNHQTWLAEDPSETSFFNI
jgi:hypothetical protein